MGRISELGDGHTNGIIHFALVIAKNSALAEKRTCALKRSGAHVKQSPPHPCEIASFFPAYRRQTFLEKTIDWMALYRHKDKHRF
jgi:hypothetical protein